MAKGITNRNRAEIYLKRIRDNDKTLKLQRDELDALRYKASGAGAIRYDKDHVQTSPQDFLSIAMDDIIRIEKQIDELESINDELKGEAYGMVRQLKETDQRTILEWYYLNGITMLDTAQRMGIGERTAYYLREDALESFGEILTI